MISGVTYWLKARKGKKSMNAKSAAKFDLESFLSFVAFNNFITCCPRVYDEDPNFL